ARGISEDRFGYTERPRRPSPQGAGRRARDRGEAARRRPHRLRRWRSGGAGRRARERREISRAHREAAAVSQRAREERRSAEKRARLQQIAVARRASARAVIRARILLRFLPGLSPAI